MARLIILGAERTEQMKDIRLIGLLRKDFAIDDFRICQPPRLMMPHGHRERRLKDGLAGMIGQLSHGVFAIVCLASRIQLISALGNGFRLFLI
jgi:hypothetical protein